MIHNAVPWKTKTPYMMFSALAIGLLSFALFFTSSSDSSDQPISDDTATWLLKRARSHLCAKRRDSRPTPQQATEPHRATLFITGFNNGRYAWPRPLMGTGNSLADALDSALGTFSNYPEANPVDADRIQIDVVSSIMPFDEVVTASHGYLPTPAAELIDPGAEGIVVEKGGRTFYLLPSEMIYKAIFSETPMDQDGDDLFGRAMVALGLPRSFWSSSQVRLSRLRTITFVENNKKARALRLIRASVPVESLSRQTLMTAERAGGEYICCMKYTEGQFCSIYA